MFHRYETAVMTFRFWSTTSPTSTLGAWENKSRAFPTKRWMRSPAIAGRAISGNCRTLWSGPPCYLPVHRCECRWLKFLLTQSSARQAGAICCSKPSESRLCELSAKAIGLSEGLMEQQPVWASRGRRSPTGCRSWGSLAHRSDGGLASAPNLCLLISCPEYRCPITPLTPTRRALKSGGSRCCLQYHWDEGSKLGVPTSERLVQLPVQHTGPHLQQQMRA